MINILKKVKEKSFIIISIIFTFVPEKVFEKFRIFSFFSNEWNIIINRIILFVIIFIIILIIVSIYLKFRKKVVITGKNYEICVMYKDIFDMKNCKKVIPFDECFTTKVGESICEIKPNSICGQYLNKNSGLNIQQLIDNTNLKSSKHKSKYKNKECYDSGKLLPNNDYLLLSFVKLDKEGLGKLSYSEYIDSLSVLWQEINKYYCQMDVCIPILGSGITRGLNLTQQELLDIIIYSYRLSNYKIKTPNKLYIVCKRNNNFSLNNIGKSVEIKI